ncbi:MAG: lipopolysaccharide biosynthesis protein RfbH [Candidatus Omnitrophica bacterium]|nr:lipopolysaccharide biosynthesis protein RfbH [Candidatus Omnitrophota bacterium]
MDKQARIRKKILKQVENYYRVQKKNKFIPGTTYIPYAGRVYDENELSFLVDASLDFWLTSGRYAAEFEKKLASFLNVKSCLLTNSGSSANLLAVTALTSSLLKSRQLKPGDEVITTACGFPTTLNPILQNNLRPVFIDVQVGTYNIRAELIEKALTKKTKAIIVAHTLGNPVNIELILKLARKYNLWFIEDNCDALGSKYKGKYTGSFGDLATGSFYPPHHITMGEGGAVLTSNPLLRRIVTSLRDWGRDCYCDSGKDDTCRKRFSQQFGDLPYGYDHKYVYSHLGYNLKVTDMQAAVGVAQLAKLPGFIKARRRNFLFLKKHLQAYPEHLILPQPQAQADPSWFGFPIMVRQDAPFSRNNLVNYLEQNKIATRMLFGGNLTKQPAYKDARYRIYRSLPNTDLVMNNLFWIGIYPGLDQARLRYVKNTLINFLKNI